MANQEGLAHARRGVELMSQMQFAVAYQSLYRGIELLIASLHEMPDGPDKNKLSTTISTLLNRAEECKRRMNPTDNRSGSKERPVSVRGSTNVHPFAPVRLQRQPTVSEEVSDPLESMIEQEILQRSPGVKWDDIAGLAQAKQAMREAIILPAQYPEVFTGLRAPPKGILLFGPPGTGKTLLAKAVATESAATFFNVTSSTLTSKFFGEAEKLVRALFSIARKRQPSVVFIDELDSILGARNSGQHEASRRLETEFLAQVDGAGNSAEDRVVLIGATNRPQELDEAVLRRMPKRIYIDLPSAETREQLIGNLLKNQPHTVSSKHLKQIVSNTSGYSGSDLAALCKEAAMIPIRSIKQSQLEARVIPPITIDHFKQAVRTIRPSVSRASLDSYMRWNQEFGSN